MTAITDKRLVHEILKKYAENEKVESTIHIERQRKEQTNKKPEATIKTKK